MIYLGLAKENIKPAVILALLFFVDGIATTLVSQTFLSYYYEMKYHFYLGKMGGVLFFSNIISIIGGVLSSKLVDKIGVMATTIYTHFPSSIVLILIGITNNPSICIFLLFCRYFISQVDVPARQAYVSMMV